MSCAVTRCGNVPKSANTLTAFQCPFAGLQAHSCCLDDWLVPVSHWPTRLFKVSGFARSAGPQNMPRFRHSAWIVCVTLATCLPSWIACQGVPATLNLYTIPGSTVSTPVHSCCLTPGQLQNCQCIPQAFEAANCRSSLDWCTKD